MSMTEKGLEAAVGVRIEEHRLNIVAVVGLVVELLAREEVVTRDEEVRPEGVAGVLPITMVLRHQSHKRTLFR